MEKREVGTAGGGKELLLEKLTLALGCLMKLPTRSRGPRGARDRTFLSWTGLELQAGSGHQQEHQPLLIEKQSWHLGGAMPRRDQGRLRAISEPILGTSGAEALLGSKEFW